MAKRAEIPITASMLQALPSAYDWMKVADAMVAAFPKLAADLVEAEKSGAVTMARAFLSLYAVKQRIDDQYKAFVALFDDTKETRVPDTLDMEGMVNVPLDEGYRIQCAETMYISIVPGMRDQAMAWLRENQVKSKDGGDMSDLIIETINASTLSAAGRFMLEEHSQDLPSEFFNSYFQPTTSVNKIQSKR